MKTQQFVKGLLMALVSVFVAAFSTTPVNYILLAVTIVGTILVYTGQNVFTLLHSDSQPGELSWINLLSGVFIAIGNGAIDGFAQFFINGAIDWNLLSRLVASVTCTYLGTTFFAPPHNDVSNKTLFKVSPKAFLFMITMLIPILGNAQGPLTGFAKLSKQNQSLIHMIEHNKDVKELLKTGQIRADDATFIDHEWLLRPAMGVKGFEIGFNSDTWEPTKKAFDEIALGFGFQKYKDIAGKPVNTVGVNLLFFFRDADITQLQFKNAVTFHYWQMMDVGIGRDWGNKYWFILTGLSYSF